MWQFMSVHHLDYLAMMRSSDRACHLRIWALATTGGFNQRIWTDPLTVGDSPYFDLAGTLPYFDTEILIFRRNQARIEPFSLPSTADRSRYLW